MSDHNRLKPCPFCGQKGARFVFYFKPEYDSYSVFIKCTNCHCRTGFAFGNENPAESRYMDDASVKSAEIWNSRPFESGGEA